MVLGLGVDMIEIARVEESIARFRDRFLSRVFTDDERAYCEKRRAKSAQSYALRWAAKEAVAKALGTGIRGGVDFKDIEVVSDALGRPAVRLSRGAARTAKAKRIACVHLSLSHDGPHAVALAVAEGKGAVAPARAARTPRASRPRATGRPARRTGARRAPKRKGGRR